MEYYLAVITFTIVSTITPGPNNIMLMVSGLNHGVRRSLPHYIGVCAGFPLLLAAVGLGLGVVFTEYPLVHPVVKVLGVGYLLYLAWRIANAANPNVSRPVSKPLTLLQAAAFQWVNPKAWVVATGAVAAFSVAGRVAESVAFIILAFTLSSMISMGLWLKFGSVLKALLSSERRVRFFNRAMAVLLVLSVIPIVMSDPGGPG